MLRQQTHSLTLEFQGCGLQSSVESHRIFKDIRAKLFLIKSRMLFNVFALITGDADLKTRMDSMSGTSATQDCSVFLPHSHCRLKACSLKNVLTGKVAQRVKMSATTPGDSETFSSDLHMYAWHAHFHIQHVCILIRIIKSIICLY